MKISRNRLLWSVLLSASCLVPTADAVDGLLAMQPGKFRPVTVAAGQPQFHIPPTSRLARNEHPRFLMDLLWHDLPAEERRELSDLVAKAVARDGSLYWRPTLHLVSVFYEGGQGPNDALFLDRMRRDFDETLVQWTDKLNHWAAGRGGSDMSHGYNGEHAYWEPFVAAIAWTHGTGEDYLDRAAFARYQSAFWNGKERVPHPNPGGHTAMAGEIFTVESGSPAKPGGGWLAVRTLAPAVGDFERRKIGGKDHDFVTGW